MPPSGAGHLLEQGLNFAGDGRELGVDGVELARRVVGVEMAVEGDLVTDAADFAVLVVALGFVNPRERDVRCDLAGEVGVDVLAERDVLVVAQVGVGFDVAFGVLADFRIVVVLAEVVLKKFEVGRVQLGGMGARRSWADRTATSTPEMRGGKTAFRHDRIQIEAVEIKSGETIVSDFFTGPAYWRVKLSPLLNTLA